MTQSRSERHLAKRVALLGISPSAATGRLRKAIILRLLQRLGEANCFRCSGKIDTPEDLTIDHKRNWLNADVALFWDLENIAFSHPRCNSKANGQSERTHCPRGHKYGDPGTYVDKNGHRKCLTCIAASVKRSRAKSKLT